MTDAALIADRLGRILTDIDRVAVAVSGGVDSTTLAALAHRTMGERATMMHAVSPAVPHEATERVKELASSEGWQLRVLDAGEFADPRYRANPSDRCFYCKTNLYGRIAEMSDALILSGTNADDLADWRPGLKAAAEHGVRHPYVEAGIDKAGVRVLSRHLGLGEIAELPASPCLSSRVETGIAIDADELRLVHRVERLLADRLAAKTVRCRIRLQGLVIELDADCLESLGEDERSALVRTIVSLDSGARAVAFKPYRMGSAFLRQAGS